MENKSIKISVLAGIIIGICVVWVGKYIVSAQTTEPAKTITAVSLTQQEADLIQNKIAYIKKNCKTDKRCQNGKLIFKNPGNIKNLVKELKIWLNNPNTIYLKK